MKRTASLLLLILPLAVALLLLSTRLVVTSGRSMEPTYRSGDTVLCIRAFRQPQKGDIVLIQRENKLVLKRIYAVAGDVIQDPDILPEVYWDGIAVPEGYLFVLGDNPDVSLDSRSKEFGLVAVEDIWGYPVLKI